MPDTTTIKEFLVAIGYKNDDAGQQKAEKGISSITVAMAGLAAAAAAAAAAITAAVVAVTKDLDDLYFASQRTHASAENLQAFGYAASQMGSSASAASAAVESMARFMRNNPGGESWLQRMGVDTRTTSGGLRDTVEIMGSLATQLRAMPYAQANARANVLGIDERTLMTMREGTGEFSDEYKNMLRIVGADSGEAAKGAHAYNVELNSLTALLGAVATKISESISGKFASDIKSFNKALQDHSADIVRVIVSMSDVLRWIADAVTKFAVATANAIQLIVTWFDSLGQTNQRFIEYTGLALVAWRALSTGFLTSPLGMIIAAFGALILVLDDFAAYKRGGKHALDWESMIPAFQKFIDPLMKALQPLHDMMHNVFGSWEGAADLFLVYFATKFIPKIIAGVATMVAGTTAATTATEATAAATGGSLLGRLAMMALKRGGPLAAFLWSMGFFDGDTNKGEDEWLKNRPQQPGGTQLPPIPKKGFFTRAHDSLFGPTPNTADGEKSISFFMQRLGLTRSQAIGIASNLQGESNFDPNATGDERDGSPTAFGIAQWRGDRLTDIEKHFGKPVQAMTLAEQLEAVAWEMESGADGGARQSLTAIRSHQSASYSTDAFLKYFERSADQGRDSNIRNSFADAYSSAMPLTGGARLGVGGYSSNTADNSSVHYAPVTNINVNGSTDPQATARAIDGNQKGVSALTIRQFQSAIL